MTKRTQIENDNPCPSTPHRLRLGTHRWCRNENPCPKEQRQRIVPWLSALFQADHLNLLVGNGLTTAIAKASRSCVVSMQPVELKSGHFKAVNRAAERSAKSSLRNKSNLEDQVRCINDLIGGLRTLSFACDSEVKPSNSGLTASQLMNDWKSELHNILRDLLNRVLATESGIHRELVSDSNKQASEVLGLLHGFLLPFGARPATRGRTHVFTLNYDRLIEYGCDLLGIRIIDRFVGCLNQVFTSSRLDIDYHYNPPGIRGEPRYLDGVIRLTKLHGSVDWLSEPCLSGYPSVFRSNLPFGSQQILSDTFDQTADQTLIYPNAAKDIETVEYPYAELFRDFSAAICRPNSVVVTYGYGFGDDHVNRVLRDMLSISSTHLVIISYDDAEGRVDAFCDSAGWKSQISLLIGNHFGDLKTLVKNYLPNPAIEEVKGRMVKLMNDRVPQNLNGSDSWLDQFNFDQE